MKKENMPVLEVKSLAKSYSTDAETLTVLKDISFILEKNQSLAVIGESGTGKSTLLNLVGGLDYVSGGEIVVFNKKIENMTETQLADFRNKNIGFIFQYHHLLPDFTALENVMLPFLIGSFNKQAAEESAAKLLGSVGLIDRLKHKPSQLSGGEQQRVAIARSLINRPGLVLMDEPTGNLDEKTSAEVMDLVWKLADEFDLTVVLVSHNLAIAAQADKCIRLSKGSSEFIHLD